MQSLITSNLAEIQSRHYVRLATSDNYWVDFAKGKLQKYKKGLATNSVL